LTQKGIKKVKTKLGFHPPCCTYSILARSLASLFWQMLVGATFTPTTGAQFCLANPATFINQKITYHGDFSLVSPAYPLYIY
jgi:hypothetical protein